jgi:hypothetical protein
VQVPLMVAVPTALLAWNSHERELDLVLAVFEFLWRLAHHEDNRVRATSSVVVTSTLSVVVALYTFWIPGSV